jgi:hypothetical protein
MVLTRIYNYPWAGKLGRLTDRCIYCGDGGFIFQISSASSSCVKCIGTKNKPIPELEQKLINTYNQKAREWCLTNGMDYDTVVAEMEKEYGGPPNQER